MLRSLLNSFAFAIAAIVAVALALAPADFVEPGDPARTLAASPPGRWQLDPVASGPIDASRLSASGLSSEQARMFADNVKGAVRVWSRPDRAGVAFAQVYESPSAISGARFFDGFLDAMQRRRAATFAVDDVAGARGFVIESEQPDVPVAAVTFRRGPRVFVVGVAAADGTDVARSFAAVQDRRAPAGGTEPHADAQAFAAASGAIFGAIAIYLIITSATMPRFRRRRSRHAIDPAANDEPGATPVDVSATVDKRRAVARASLVAKAVGMSLVLPALAPQLWPVSLAPGAVGLLLAIAGVALTRGKRWGARAVLVLLALVNIVLLAIALRGCRVVLRSELDPIVSESPGGKRYRRLFTGRRIVRVAGSVAVAAVLTLSGALALVAASADALAGENVSVRALSALACFGLAVVPYRRARRQASPLAAAVTRRDARPPIVYLRSFRDDDVTVASHGGATWHSALERFAARRRERFEEVVAGHLWSYGPVVAVSAPDEDLAPLGAARINLDHAQWQTGVEDWLARSELIVLSVGRTAGVAWELAKIAQLELWDRTIVVFPPLQSAELQARWRVLADTARGAGKDLDEVFDAARVLAVALCDGDAVIVAGRERDASHYAAALDAAISTVRTPVVSARLAVA